MSVASALLHFLLQPVPPSALAPAKIAVPVNSARSYIDAAVGMPLGACALLSVLGPQARCNVATAAIFRNSDRFKVIRVDAEPCSAEMVDLVPVWDGPNERLVRKAVAGHVSRGPDVEAGILPNTLGWAGPYPAPARREAEKIHKSRNWLRWRSTHAVTLTYAELKGYHRG